MSQPELISPAKNGPERATLVSFLDYYRTVLLRKAWGLSSEQLATALPPSSLTLGGLLYHMALVEDAWFSYEFAGNEEREPWASVDWETTPDWDFDTAPSLSAAELTDAYKAAVTRSQQITTAASSLDDLSARTRTDDGEHWDLRWILVHMIEEYARHCGHADFLREALDGQTGD